MDGQVNRQKDGQVDGWIERWGAVTVHGWMDRWKETGRWMERWGERGTNAWMDRWTEGWMIAREGLRKTQVPSGQGAQGPPWVWLMACFCCTETPCHAERRTGPEVKALAVIWVVRASTSAPFSVSWSSLPCQLYWAVPRLKGDGKAEMTWERRRRFVPLQTVSLCGQIRPKWSGTDMWDRALGSLSSFQVSFNTVMMPLCITKSKTVSISSTYECKLLLC